MDSDFNANANANANADVYRKATDAAAAECREIQTEIMNLEARVIGLQAREATLNVLTRTLGELLPKSQGNNSPYVPSFSIADMPLQTRPVAAGDHRFGGAAGR